MRWFEAGPLVFVPTAVASDFTVSDPARSLISQHLSSITREMWTLRVCTVEVLVRLKTDIS